jgi:hypothetical protein
MKVAIGIVVGVVAVILLGAVSCMALVGGAVSTMDDTAQTSPGDTPSGETEESPIKFSAADAGTATDYAGQTYTVVEISIVNESDSENVYVDPWSFSAETADGSVVSLDDFSADLTDPLEAVDVGPGQSVSGQLAASGDVDIAKVQWENNLLSNEKETVEVE